MFEKSCLGEIEKNRINIRDKIKKKYARDKLRIKQKSNSYVCPYRRTRMFERPNVGRKGRYNKTRINVDSIGRIDGCPLAGAGAAAHEG